MYSLTFLHKITSSAKLIFFFDFTTEGRSLMVHTRLGTVLVVQCDSLHVHLTRKH